MVALGVWNIHKAMQKTKAAVRHEAKGSLTEMMHFEELSRGFENMGLALLFLCWLPCSNAAWITQAACEVRIERMAAMHHEPIHDSGKVATKIATRDAMPVDYRVTLADGSEVSWRLKDESLRRAEQRRSTVNAGRSSSSTGIAGDTTAGADELRNGAHDAVNRVSIGSEQTNGNQAF